jgi:hypothetical protein
MVFSKNTMILIPWPYISTFHEVLFVEDSPTMNLPPNKHEYILFTLKPFFKNVLKEDSYTCNGD